jgi:SH3-like domain-containing protein
MTRLVPLPLALALVVMALATAHAQGSGLPLPRFVSLRSDQVNMRAGPGVRYPVDWVYLRQDLPVEVIAEFDTWRKIRDPDGAEGWVHQSMLTGRRNVMIRQDKAMLRRTADDIASPSAWLQAGVLGKLIQCPRDSIYCRVEVSGYQGWLRRDEVWGVYRSETVD